MLTIGRVAFTVFDPKCRTCPMHAARWQIRVIGAWQDRAEAIEGARPAD